MTAAKSAPGQGPKLTVVDGAQTASPGQRLMRARMARNLDIEDVARHLNLSLSMVKALEGDNFKSLPGRAFVKGYLRNYGRLVGIDGDDLVRSYESQSETSDEVLVDLAEARHPPRWIAPLFRILGYLMMIVLLIGVGAFIYQNIDVIADKAGQLSSSIKNDASSAEEVPASAAPSHDPGAVRLSIPLHPVEGSAPAAASEQGANAIGGESQAAPAAPVTPEAGNEKDSRDVVIPSESDVKNATGEEVRQEGKTIPRQESIPSPGPQSQGRIDNKPAQQTELREAGPAAQADSAPVAVSSVESSLGLVFSGLSWVRVKDANDKILFDGTRAAGAEVQLQGRAPFNIRLGNAPAVRVVLNGKPREIDFSRRSNVAQLTLGED